MTSTSSQASLTRPHCPSFSVERRRCGEKPLTAVMWCVDLRSRAVPKSPNGTPCNITPTTLSIDRLKPSSPERPPPPSANGATTSSPTRPRRGWRTDSKTSAAFCSSAASLRRLSRTQTRAPHRPGRAAAGHSRGRPKYYKNGIINVARGLRATTRAFTAASHYVIPARLDKITARELTPRTASALRLSTSPTR